jgi:uncharacterized protein (DUF934 family)
MLIFAPPTSGSLIRTAVLGYSRLRRSFMPLIKDGAIIADPWVFVSDESALPADGRVIVTLERWRAERATLLGQFTEVGVVLKSDQPADEIANDLRHLRLIALDFPIFRDGRAYSTARLLRERYGFLGELRAVGNVLPDQFFFMLRCGIDTFQVADDRKALEWQKAVSAFSAVYQTAADGRTAVSRLRQQRKEAAE